MIKIENYKFLLIFFKIAIFFKIDILCRKFCTSNALIKNNYVTNSWVKGPITQNNYYLTSVPKFSIFAQIKKNMAEHFWLIYATSAQTVDFRTCQVRYFYNECGKSTFWYYFWVIPESERLHHNTHLDYYCYFFRPYSTSTETQINDGGWNFISNIKCEIQRLVPRFLVLYFINTSNSR